MAVFDQDDLTGSEGPGPWPAFTDLLSATTLLFLILFAATAVPAIERVRAAENELQVRESTLAQLDSMLRQQNAGVEVYRVGDYLRVTIPGEATFPINRYELDQLRPEGRAILRSFADTILSRPALIDAIDQIQVVGHTSSEGGDELNWRLSAERAATVALFLIEEAGLDACKITALGRGRYYPLDPETSREGMVDPNNRRIELEIRPIIPSDPDQLRRRQECVSYQPQP
jgi:outer membrane protein OmpA-like peptidoglycan-associated protein